MVILRLYRPPRAAQGGTVPSGDNLSWRAPSALGPVPEILMTSKLASLFALTALLTLTGQEAPRIVPGTLTLEEVVRLAKSGLSEELQVATVKQNAKAFNLNSDEMLELEKSGVSKTVIRYLLDPAVAYMPPALPPNASSPPAAKVVPSAPRRRPRTLWL